MQATAIAPGIPNLRTIASFIFTPLPGRYPLVKFLVSAGIVGLGNNFKSCVDIIEIYENFELAPDLCMILIMTNFSQLR